MAEMGYNYSAPYRGIGQVTPTGVMEAMTAPGRNIGSGLAGIGEGIASMIQRYQQTKAERDLASGELEGLISQYIPQNQNLPSGESGGVDLGSFGRIVGEKNVKKFVEGKASTADMLAMSHSIKTAQAERDKALEREATSLQIDALKRKQVADVEALNQANSTRDAIKFALTDQNKPDFNNLGQVGSNSVGVSPVPYEEARTNLAKYLAATNAAPETFSAIDQILSIAGKRPTQVVQSGTTPQGATWVNVNGKTEIFAPPKLEGKDLTVEQANALSFASRLHLNDQTIKSVLDSGFKSKSLSEFSFMPERFRSDSRKIFEAAKQNWIAAALRKESGASIGEKEYSDADKQYFPQEGDPKSVLDQKAKLRETVFKTMKLGIGKHGDEYLGQVIGQDSGASTNQPTQMKRVQFNPALVK